MWPISSLASRLRLRCRNGSISAPLVGTCNHWCWRSTRRPVSSAGKAGVLGPMPDGDGPQQSGHAPQRGHACRQQVSEERLQAETDWHGSGGCAGACALTAAFADRTVPDHLADNILLAALLASHPGWIGAVAASASKFQLQLCPLAIKTAPWCRKRTVTTTGLKCLRPVGRNGARPLSRHARGHRRRRQPQARVGDPATVRPAPARRPIPNARTE